MRAQLCCVRENIFFMHAGTEKGHEKTDIDSVRSIEEVVLIFNLSIIFTRSFSKIKNVSERKNKVVK